MYHEGQRQTRCKIINFKLSKATILLYKALVDVLTLVLPKYDYVFI